MLNSTNQNKKTKLLSYLMVMLLIANIFTPYDSSYATGMDKTALIQKALTVTLTQDGVATTEIDVSKPFELQGKFDFDINHESDDDPEKIKQGDTASIYITDGVKLSDEQQKPQTLLDEKISGKSVATLTLRNEGDSKKVYADIVFGGEMFSEYAEAGIILKASLKLDKDPSGIPEAGETIQILEKTFTLKPPAVKFEYKFVKDGVRKGNIISWTVDAEVLKNDLPHPLRGYRFSDELKDVGEFVPGSFKVDGNSIVDPSGAKLEYTFDTDNSKAKITFDTKIPDSIYYSQSITKTTLDPVKGIIVEAGDKTVTNEAKLSGSDGTELAKAAKAISFKPIWIAKAGEGEKGSSGIYDPKNHTISWTITANQEEARLKDAYILDKLSETSGTANAGGQNLGPLTLDKTSVTLQIWDKVQGKWGAPQALTETSSGPRIEGERFYLTGPGEYTQQRTRKSSSLTPMILLIAGK